MNDISPQQEAQIKEVIAQGNLIAAIKLYREATGVGLKEAKDAVEAIQRGEPVHAPPINPSLQGDALLEEQIKRLLAKHQKIQAVKLYREAYNCGLKEAKDAVDAIEAGIRTSLPNAPVISDDPFAEDNRRNLPFYILVIALVLLGIAGLTFFALFLANNGF